MKTVYVIARGDDTIIGTHAYESKEAAIEHLRQKAARDSEGWEPVRITWPTPTKYIIEVLDGKDTIIGDAHLCELDFIPEEEK